MIVVKIQRPLRTNAPVPTALVYTRDRAIQFQVAFTAVADLFTSVDLKVYAAVTLEGGVMTIVKKIDPQGW